MWTSKVWDMYYHVCVSLCVILISLAAYGFAGWLRTLICLRKQMPSLEGHPLLGSFSFMQDPGWHRNMFDVLQKLGPIFHMRLGHKNVRNLSAQQYCLNLDLPHMLKA